MLLNIIRWVIFFYFSQTAYLLLSYLTDGAASIYTHHVMPQTGFDLTRILYELTGIGTHVSRIFTSKRDLNLGPHYRLSYRDRSKKVLEELVPDAVEDIAVGEDPDVDVVDQDRVKLTGFLIPEKRVRHPDLARIREGQVFHPA